MKVIPSSSGFAAMGLCCEPTGRRKADFRMSLRAKVRRGLEGLLGKSNLQRYPMREIAGRFNKALQTPSPRGLLLLRVRSGNGCFGGLKSDFGVSAVAERLVGGSAAAAERDGRFSGKVPLGSVGVDQLNRAFYAKGAVGAHSDFDFVFRHKLLLERFFS
jgi:hypothetical protein